MFQPEPRFARIAALMADPTRARMLAVLLSGEYRTAGELASAADVTPQAATTQLAQLVEGGLLTMHPQGRHKYYALADADIAHALEALSLVAERDAVADRWRTPAYQPLKHARRCYGHLAGELGVAHFQGLLRRGFLSDQADGLVLTDTGHRWLTDLGVKPPGSGRYAYRCLDWSERRDHLAGTLAKAMLDHYMRQGWVVAGETSRALTLTREGRQWFAALTG